MRKQLITVCIETSPHTGLIHETAFKTWTSWINLLYCRYLKSQTLKVSFDMQLWRFWLYPRLRFGALLWAFLVKRQFLNWKSNQYNFPGSMVHDSWRVWFLSCQLAIYDRFKLIWKSWVQLSFMVFGYSNNIYHYNDQDVWCFRSSRV